MALRRVSQLGRVTCGVVRTSRWHNRAGSRLVASRRVQARRQHAPTSAVYRRYRHAATTAMAGLCPKQKTWHGVDHSPGLRQGPRSLATAASVVAMSKYGFTWEDCLASLRAMPDSSVGVYMGDASCYDIFREEVMPFVIKSHKLEGSPLLQQRKLHPGYEFMAPDPVELSHVVLSTRVRVARNLIGFPFTPNMSDMQRMAVRLLVEKCLTALPGRFFFLQDINDRLLAHFKQHRVPVFGNSDPYIAAANIYDGWPKDRALWVSEDHKVTVWINEEDHLRVMAIAEGFALAEVTERVDELLDILDDEVGFARNNMFGFLSTCPSNLGTGLRASVHVQTNGKDFKPAFDALNMQLRPSGGESARGQADDGIRDVSCRERMGLTEKQVLTKLQNGLVEVFGTADNPKL